MRISYSLPRCIYGNKLLFYEYFRPGIFGLCSSIQRSDRTPLFLIRFRRVFPTLGAFQSFRILSTERSKIAPASEGTNHLKDRRATKLASKVIKRTFPDYFKSRPQLIILQPSTPRQRKNNHSSQFHPFPNFKITHFSKIFRQNYSLFFPSYGFVIFNFPSDPDKNYERDSNYIKGTKIGSTIPIICLTSFLFHIDLIQ